MEQRDSELAGVVRWQAAPGQNGRTGRGDYASHVTRHMSHVTRQTSHVTRHTSHLTPHTSHVSRHTSVLTLPQSKKVIVMATSALWHGLYPGACMRWGLLRCGMLHASCCAGYYCTFLLAAFWSEAEKKLFAAVAPFSKVCYFAPLNFQFEAIFG